jgi:hypothetical protein
MDSARRHLIALAYLHRFFRLTINKQHHLAFQHIAGFRTRMRVTTDVYVGDDFGDPYHRFVVGAGYVEFLQWNALDGCGLLRRRRELLSTGDSSTCRNFATISSGLYRFLAIAVLLDVKDIPQVGPLQWGRISDTDIDIAAGGAIGLECVEKADSEAYSERPAKQHRSEPAIGPRYIDPREGLYVFPTLTSEDFRRPKEMPSTVGRLRLLATSRRCRHRRAGLARMIPPARK